MALNAEPRRARQARFEHERALLDMRPAVAAAIDPAFAERLGSAAVLDAVDEALAQLVAADAHLGELAQVKTLWVTVARRRVIDQARSAETRYRAVAAESAIRIAGRSEPFGVVTERLDAARQRCRVVEILSVLHGDQRRWAEAWYDEVLSAKRSRGGQPRGLATALGWSSAKTKSVSRRARAKLTDFITARATGAVCAEQRALLDAFVLATERDREPSDERYATVLVHVAGCEECWAAWQGRRRDLLRRGQAALYLPFEAASGKLEAAWAKIGELATSAYVQAGVLPARLGLGGAAAAGGGAATIGAKATAVCVGVVCAAAAGGEVAGVLPPIAGTSREQVRTGVTRPAAAPVVRAARGRAQMSPVVRGFGDARRTSSALSRAVQKARPAPAPAMQMKAKVRETLRARRQGTGRPRAARRAPAPVFTAAPPPAGSRAEFVAPCPPRTFVC